MTEENYINFQVSQFVKIFKHFFPELVLLAQETLSPESFKQKLQDYLNTACQDEEATSEGKKAANRILLLINYDNATINELSIGEKIHVRTISYLWKFLREELEEEISSDFILDLFHQFKSLKLSPAIKPDRNLLKKQMNRWASGLDESVVAVRKKNRDRIIKGLIKKIERRHAPSSRYQFEEGMTYEDKYRLVSEWWNSSRFHLSLAIKSPTELNTFLGNTLSDETMRLFLLARKKGMPFFVTPYYLSLLSTEKEYDDMTIRSYVLYSNELIETYGEIKAWEKEDVLVSGKPNAAGWLLPEGNNIHRRYPEVAILIPDSMGRACGGLCASCQRMYDFQSERLNFDFEALKPKESWDKKLRRLIAYFEEDTQLRDILITGGDALMSQNATLRRILDAIYKMAIRKRKANERRPEGEKYAEIQRVRLGTRLLAYLPLRVTDDLIAILKEFKEKASAVGIKQCYIQTHFQSPLEVTPEAKKAIEAILSAGWTVTNQLVYNVAASRRGHTAKLRQVLNSVGVVCYYTFSVKGFNENYAVFAPNSRSLQEANEEKIFGLIPEDKQEELHHIIQDKRPLEKYLLRFLKENNLLFAGTDRNVLNLPGIGKSMTFKVVGITAEGKRILRFEHDASRIHSPIIYTMGKVYIVENKSIAAYLRQLKAMGEDVSEYRSIWYYCEGQTEPQFSLYKYPNYAFAISEKMTNLQIDD